MPQLLMIVQVFIPQSQSHHPLEQKFFDGEFDEFFVPMVGETPGKLRDDPEPLFDLPQKQSARIGGDLPPIEIGENFASSTGLKEEALPLHSVMTRRPCSVCCGLCDHNTLRKIGRLLNYAQ